MAREWWYDECGTNLLKGIYDDPDNLPLLEDNHIIEFLNHVPAALESFRRIVPNMLPEEQERLWPLSVGIPQYNYSDPGVESDSFQNRWNRSGIRTAGPRGGGAPFPR